MRAVVYEPETGRWLIDRGGSVIELSAAAFDALCASVRQKAVEVDAAGGEPGFRPVPGEALGDEHAVLPDLESPGGGGLDPPDMV